MRLARVAPRVAARGARAVGTAPAAADRRSGSRRGVRPRPRRVVPRRRAVARARARVPRPAWGFELSDVRAPVTLWWGRGDRVCPPSIGERFARAPAEAELRVVDGTHQLLFARWRDILADAARRHAADVESPRPFRSESWRCPCRSSHSQPSSPYSCLPQQAAAARRRAPPATPRRPPARRPLAAAAFKVGLVTDTGGLNDRGFNHLAYVGLQRAQRDLGVQDARRPVASRRRSTSRT